METAEIRDACANHMAFVHESVGVAAEQYRAMERREVYTTPKSYLELIALYKSELEKNRGTLGVLKGRLEEGLIKLKDAQEQVADMQVRMRRMECGPQLTSCRIPLPPPSPICRCGLRKRPSLLRRRRKRRTSS